MASMGGGDMGVMGGMPGMGARSPEDHKQEVAALKAVRISAAAVSCFFSFLVQCFVFRRFFFFFFISIFRGDSGRLCMPWPCGSCLSCSFGRTIKVRTFFPMYFFFFVFLLNTAEQTGAPFYLELLVLIVWIISFSSILLPRTPVLGPKRRKHTSKTAPSIFYHLRGGVRRQQALSLFGWCRK